MEEEKLEKKKKRKTTNGRDASVRRSQKKTIASAIVFSGILIQRQRLPRNAQRSEYNLPFRRRIKSPSRSRDFSRSAQQGDPFAIKEKEARVISCCSQSRK